MTEIKCTYCHNNHHLYQCLKFKDIECNKRWKFVKENHLCFCCLRSGHSAANCTSRRECGLNSCKRIHNRLLHETLSVKEEGGNSKPISSTDTDFRKQLVDKTSSVHTIFEGKSSKKTLFKFLPIEIKGPRGKCKVMAFIDDGSKISLIEESVVKAVGLKGPQDLLSLRWIGGKTTSELSQHIDLEVTGVGENIPYYQIRNVRTTKKLELPAQTLNFDSFKLKYKISNDISVDDYENAIPRMLIGMPHINLVRPLEVINLDECFSIHRSNLGCILFGSNEESADGVVCRIDCDVSTMRDIQKQMAEYFSIDNFGVKPLQPVISEADKRAQTILFETTKQSATQYKTGLLWAYNEIEFVESYNMALRRLEIIESKISKDKTFFEWYNNKIAEYINKSYARKLSHSEALKICPQTWYLPHFAVCNIYKENKRRLVFD
ncbi:uncharacterized protein LOC111591729 [Ceratitis capitata]|uniref:uncharacterized protein LOC111591729 n=1 Tax=Ceratitis capitata TaxID=7213 RepID=UPI000C6C677D|nr:uncharacterized protein LOC111591729 [Ceratitis capitata]